MRSIDRENLYKFLTDQRVKERGAYSKGVNTGLDIARSALRNEQIAPTLTPPNEWVSVEERLPEPGERVLAANGSFVGEAYLASNGTWMRHDGFPWKVDCWMPMPDRRQPEGEA